MPLLVITNNGLQKLPLKKTTPTGISLATKESKRSVSGKHAKKSLGEGEDSLSKVSGPAEEKQGLGEGGSIKEDLRRSEVSLRQNKQQEEEEEQVGGASVQSRRAGCV